MRQKYVLHQLCLLLSATLLLGAVVSPLEHSDNTVRDITERQAIMQLLAADDFAAARDRLAAYVESNPADGIMVYNYACVLAQLDELESAERWLLKAVSSGYMNFSTMKRDKDLESIRESASFRAIMAARDAADPAITDRRNRAWLERLEDADYHLVPSVDELPIDLITHRSSHEVTSIQYQIQLTYNTLATFFETPLPHRVTIVVLEDKQLQDVMPNRFVKGRYVHTNRELASDGSPLVISHELTHAFHHAIMDADGQDHAIWIQEGLATLFEACAVGHDGNMFFSNDRHFDVMNAITQDNLDTWQQLFHSDTHEFHHLPRQRYAHVRSIFEYFHSEGKLADWWNTYREHASVDPTGILATETVFGKSIDFIELDWLNWCKHRSVVQFANGAGIVDARLAMANSEYESPSSETAAMLEQQLGRSTLDEIEARTLYERLKSQPMHSRDERIGTLRNIVTLDAKHAAARYELGLLLIEDGKLELAEESMLALQVIDANLASLLDSLLQSRLQK